MGHWVEGLGFSGSRFNPKQLSILRLSQRTSVRVGLGNDGRDSYLASR